MKNFIIKTPEFILTKMTADDGDKYYRLSNNPRVMKFVTGFALTRQESDKMLQSFLKENNTDTFYGRYLIEERKTRALVGIAKLEAYGEEVEIGYRIMEDYWGKGVATKIAGFLIRFSFKTFSPPAVIAFVNVDNAASIRVLEKAGMSNLERIEDFDEAKYKFSRLPDRNLVSKKVIYITLGVVIIAVLTAFFFR